jgi:multicomponent Na+:H+ antiporter subunit G
MWEYVTALLLVSGGAFACIAGLGLVRMPDVYIRMHAATKAGTLGTGLILAAVAVHFADAAVAMRALAAIAFLLITAPVAAHMIGRAAYRTGVPLWEGSIIDEWQGRVRQSPSQSAAQQERSST